MFSAIVVLYVILPKSCVIDEAPATNGISNITKYHFNRRQWVGIHA